MLSGFSLNLAKKDDTSTEKPLFSFSTPLTSSSNSTLGGSTLFGNKDGVTAAPAASSTTPAPSAFGGLVGSTTGSTLFGASTTNSSAFDASKSAFGIGAGNSSTTTKPAASAFGATTTTTTPGFSSGLGFSKTEEKKDVATPSFSFAPSDNTATSKTTFGQMSSTTAPSGSLSFNTSAASSGSSAFGQKAGFTLNSTPATSASTDATKPAFSFSAPADKKKETSLFGSSSSATTPAAGLSFGNSTGTLFGAKTDAPKPTSSIFGGASANDSKPSLFGSKPDAPGPSRPLFGSQSEASKSTGLFGSKLEGASEPATSIFGSKPDTTSKPTTSLFGSKPDDTSKPAAPLFGSKPDTTSKPATPIFGLKTDTASNTSTSLFGSKPEEASKTGTSLFGGAAKTESANAAENKDDSKAKAEPLSESSKPITENKTDAKDDAELAAKKTAKLKIPTEQDTAVYLQSRSLEDIISKWTMALSKRTSEFQTQAVDIASWDRVLSENGDRISQMYTDVVAAERKQSTIDQSLDYINRQQDDIEALLDTYEAQAQELLSDLAGPDGLQPVDQEREKSYRLAEELNEKLESMGNNLGTVINEINDVSTDLTGTKTDDDPLTQIVKVLNSHLSSLQWIDTHTNELQEKLEQIEVLKSQTRDNLDVSNKVYGARHFR